MTGYIVEREIVWLVRVIVSMISCIITVCMNECTLCYPGAEKNKTFHIVQKAKAIRTGTRSSKSSKQSYKHVARKRDVGKLINEKREELRETRLSHGYYYIYVRAVPLYRAPPLCTILQLSWCLGLKAKKNW